MSVDFLSKGNPDGTSVGQGATDKVALYGGTPVVQPSGAAGAVIARGLQAGVVATINTSQTPAGVVSNGTTTATISAISSAPQGYQITPNDLVYVNKPSAQAGLGIGNVRVSAANIIALQFQNLSGAVVTPTAGEKYGIVALSGFPTLTVTLSPAVVASATIAEQQFTVTGLRAGELVQVSKPTDQAGLSIAGCRVVAANTLGITFMNNTGALITPTATEKYTVFAIGGMDAVNSDLIAKVSVGTRTAVAVTGTAEQGVTMTGLAASDTLKGVSKNTAQVGLGVAGIRVSGANALGILYSNNSAATITPTAAEVYDVSITRPVPAAPLVVYTQSLAPASVAASTTAEQGFTVTGLVSNSMVWVNKPSATAGLAVVGCRVSGANALAITFANLTAAAITPPTESYVIGNYQMTLGDDQSTWLQTASVVNTNISVLLNALRNANVNLGVLAGS